MYHLTHDAFPADYRALVEHSILSSPHLGPSPLGPEFVATRGFSIIFKRLAFAALVEEFPYLGPFIAAAAFPHSNAFYVNPLVMTGGSRVDAHIDCRLVEAQNMRIIPTLVSIFYVRADPDKGGALHLRTEDRGEVAVSPRTNDLLHFPGRLVHSVDAVEGGDSRISLVCEQYNLREDVLAGFPEFEVILAGDHAPRANPLAGASGPALQ